MYTEKRYLGKFEGCNSALVAEILYRVSADGCESVGNVSEVGLWAGLIEGKRYGFIVTEDSQGFVDYAVYGKKEAREQFDKLAEELEPEEGE